LWRRGFGAYRTILDEAWKPYLDGSGTLDDAVRRIVERLP
jgi:hypothetical protein